VFSFLQFLSLLCCVCVCVCVVCGLIRAIQVIINSFFFFFQNSTELSFCALIARIQAMQLPNYFKVTI